MLKVVDEYACGGEFPTDALKQFPGSVVIAKLRKAESRGWIVRGRDNGWSLTPKGRDVLGEAE